MSFTIIFFFLLSENVFERNSKSGSKISREMWSENFVLYVNFMVKIN